MSCACTILPFSLVAAFNFVTVLLRCMLSSLFLCLYRFHFSRLIACSLFPRMKLCCQNHFSMSMVPDSSANVQIDEITSATAMIPDSPDSPDQQSSPASYVPIVRPGEQGALAPMPQSADLADIQATVLQPVHRQFRPFRTNVTMPTIAVPAPPTTSAEDLTYYFGSSSWMNCSSWFLIFIYGAKSLPW
ncbi:unnamed protein product [Clavelina lepadiformis]|uniref:Uncharacterized protein n=1 Tax=Clavelina lepadiformis TaxID=159417 RepID=A0ABP0F990_CLALP